MAPLRCDDESLDTLGWLPHASAAADNGDEQLHFSFPAILGGLTDDGDAFEPHGVAGGMVFTDQHLYVVDESNAVVTKEEVMSIIDLKVEATHHLLMLETSEERKWVVKSTAGDGPCATAAAIAELYADKLVPVAAEDMDVNEALEGCSRDFLQMLGVAALVEDPSARPSGLTEVERLEQRRAQRRAEQEEILAAESPRFSDRKKVDAIPADASFGTMARLAQAAQEARVNGKASPPPVPTADDDDNNNSNTAETSDEAANRGPMQEQARVRDEAEEEAAAAEAAQKKAEEEAAAKAAAEAEAERERVRREEEEAAAAAAAAAEAEAEAERKAAEAAAAVERERVQKEEEEAAVAAEAAAAEQARKQREADEREEAAAEAARQQAAAEEEERKRKAAAAAEQEAAEEAATAAAAERERMRVEEEAAAAAAAAETAAQAEAEAQQHAAEEERRRCEAAAAAEQTAAAASAAEETGLEPEPVVPEADPAAAARAADLDRDRVVQIAREKVRASKATADMGRIVDLLTLPGSAEEEAEAEPTDATLAPAPAPATPVEVREHHHQATAVYHTTNAAALATPATPVTDSVFPAAGVRGTSPGGSPKVPQHRRSCGDDIAGIHGGARALPDGREGPGPARGGSPDEWRAARASVSPMRQPAHGQQYAVDVDVRHVGEGVRDTRWSGHRVTLVGNGPAGSPHAHHHHHHPHHSSTTASPLRSRSATPNAGVPVRASSPHAGGFMDEIDRVIEEIQAKHHPLENGYSSPRRARGAGTPGDPSTGASASGLGPGESIHGSPGRGGESPPSYPPPPMVDGSPLRNGEPLTVLQGQGVGAARRSPSPHRSASASPSPQYVGGHGVSAGLTGSPASMATIQRLKDRFSPPPAHASAGAADAPGADAPGGARPHAAGPGQRFSRGYATAAPKRASDGLLARLTVKKQEAATRGDGDEVRRLDLVMAAVEGVHVGAGTAASVAPPLGTPGDPGSLPRYPPQDLNPRAYDVLGLKERASQWLDGLSSHKRLAGSSASSSRSPSAQQRSSYGGPPAPAATPASMPSVDAAARTRHASSSQTPDVARRLLLYRMRKQRSRSVDAAAAAGRH